MAIYHFQVKTHSRQTGANAIRSACYRAGSRIRDETTGRTYNYQRKQEVAHTEIIGPATAPAWVSDRSRLWHEVETREKYKNARLFREIVAALPLELDLVRSTALVQDFVINEVTSYGMVADIAIHFKHANPHVHVSIPDREIDETGFTRKNRDWNNKAVVIRWRKSWADYVNRHLAHAGFGEDHFIDHRTLEEQGVKRQPTIHVGRETQWTKESHARKVEHNNIVKAEAKLDKVAETLIAELDEISTELNGTEGALAALGGADIEKCLIDPPAAPKEECPVILLLAPPQNAMHDNGYDDEYESRKRFFAVLERKPYSRVKFDDDMSRMSSKLGGSRLRWWLFNYRELFTRYPNLAAEAQKCIPPDIRLWIANCLTMLGEERTLNQFSSVDFMEEARRRVPWPGDDKPFLEKSTLIVSGQQSESSLDVSSLAKDRIRLHYIGGRLAGVEHGSAPLDVERGIKLHAPRQEDRFAEMNLKTVITDAEALFHERRRVCAAMGWSYSWYRFYEDVKRLHDPNHRHTEMLDWWLDFFDRAYDRGALTQTSMFSALYTATPIRYRKYLKQPFEAPPLRENSGPSAVVEIDAEVQLTTVASAVDSELSLGPAS